MPNVWMSHVKDYASANGLTFKNALSDKGCRNAYYDKTLGKPEEKPSVVKPVVKSKPVKAKPEPVAADPVKEAPVEKKKRAPRKRDAQPSSESVSHQ